MTRSVNATPASPSQKHHVVVQLSNMRRVLLVITHGIILSPLIFWSALINNFIAPRQVWVTTLFICAIGALVVYLWQHGARIRVQWWDVLLLALLIIATATSLISSADVSESVWSTPWRGTGLLLWWLWFMWYVGARVMQWNDREWRGIYLSHGVALVGTALIVALQVVNPEFIKLSNGDRPSGLLGNSVFLGLYAAPYVFLPWLVIPKEKMWRYGAALISLCAIGMILVTQARASLLASIIGGGVGVSALFWFTRRDAAMARVRRIATILVVCGVLGFVALATYGQVSNSDRIKRLTFNVNYLATLKSRFVNWGVAMQAVRERPLRGWGFEQYRTAVEKHYSPELAKYSFMETRIDKPHNVYLEWLVMTGIFGFVVYVALCVVLLWYGWRLQQPVAAAVWLAAISTILVQEFFAFFTLQTMVMLAFLLLLMERRGGMVPVRELSIPALRARPVVWGTGAVIAAAALLFILWRGVWGVGLGAYHAQQAVDAQARGDSAAIISHATQALDSMGVGPYDFETWRWVAHALLTDAAVGHVPTDARWRTQVERLARLTTDLASRHNDSAHWMLFAGKIEYHLALATDDRAHLITAQNYFLRAIEISPQRQESHLMLVYVHALRGEYAQVLERFKLASVVASDFEFINAIDFVARRLEKEKNYPMLVALYEWRVTRINTAPAHAVLAAAYAANGQYAQARAAVARAVALDPSFASEAELFLKTVPNR